MKKFLFLSLTSAMCSVIMNGCTISTSVSNPSYPEFISTHHTSTTLSEKNYLSESYQGKIKEFVMGNQKDRSIFPPTNGYKNITDIMVANDLGDKKDQPINFAFNYNYSPTCKATTAADKFDERYCFKDDIYIFKIENLDKIGSSGEKKSLVYNDKTIATGICWNGALDPIEDVRIVDDRLAFTVWQNCDFNNPQQARRNIYYKGESYNEKYGTQSSYYLFSYKSKIGFVIQKNGKEYVFFNDRIISPGYNQILTHGCCMNPYYFVVFKNGKLDFMAIKDEKDYLVEIDLNDYVK